MRKEMNADDQIVECFQQEAFDFGRAQLGISNSSFIKALEDYAEWETSAEQEIATLTEGLEEALRILRLPYSPKNEVHQQAAVSAIFDYATRLIDLDATVQTGNVVAEPLLQAIVHGVPKGACAEEVLALWNKAIVLIASNDSCYYIGHALERALETVQPEAPIVVNAGIKAAFCQHKLTVPAFYRRSEVLGILKKHALHAVEQFHGCVEDDAQRVHLLEWATRLSPVDSGQEQRLTSAWTQAVLAFAWRDFDGARQAVKAATYYPLKIRGVEDDESVKSDDACTTQYFKQQSRLLCKDFDKAAREDNKIEALYRPWRDMGLDEMLPVAAARLSL